MTIELNPEQQQILIDSMRDRISKLYKMSEAYRSNCDFVAQMDCIDEKIRVEKVLEIFTEL